MTPEKLIKRQKFIKGKPLKNRATNAVSSRRDKNHVVMNTEVNEEYDTFFDFEEGLGDLLPSNQQAASVADTPSVEVEIKGAATPYIQLEPEDNIDTKETLSSPVVMDVEPIKTNHEPVMMSLDAETDVGVESPGDAVIMDKIYSVEDKPKYMNVKGFKFSQCSYIKRDGEQCRRQAPKGKNICSIHKRMAKSKK